MSMRIGLRGVATSVLALAAALALPPAAATQEITCSDCHDVSLPAASVHGSFACTDCHTDIAEFPHPDSVRLGDAVCAQCHDAADVLATSVHADLVDCQTCHGAAHEILPVSDADSPASPLKQIATCGQCHGGDDGLIAGYLDSVHGRGLVRSGLAVAPSCSDCHGSHGILPPSDPASRVSHQKVPETCGSCHEFILDDFRDRSTHGALWKAGNEAGPVCITCHTSHKVQEPWERAQRLKSPETCGGCHGGRFVSYRDSFHGKATDLGFVTAAVCSDCHTPHKNLPASDPRSSIAPANLAATCGACHGEVGPKFLSFDPHSEPRDATQNPTVHGVWVFMTALLIGVFGFFGLHDLLWLQRSVVGWLRGEFRRVPEQGGPHVRRFKKANIGVHLTIISTFLVLAATGLPLKFHYTAWAHAIGSVPGALVLTRWLHRLAAVATFGYAFFHLTYLIRRSAKDRGILWGWRSLVPWLGDARDLWRNLRYFLYAGPRPHFDRWTYWEKFDYFAVFWGIPVIGLSGLMLWFPSLFTHFLPGWMLNVAFVVHSDEALLATGFIFIFHFFHTHLRPESFPLDPVIFTGSMPLERFKEERPAEYRRLVERGELEELLVDPPSEARMRFARIFGFSALTVGLLLAAAILWGMLRL